MGALISEWWLKQSGSRRLFIILWSLVALLIGLYGVHVCRRLYAITALHTDVQTSLRFVDTALKPAPTSPSKYIKFRSPSYITNTSLPDNIKCLMGTVDVISCVRLVTVWYQTEHSDLGSTPIPLQHIRMLNEAQEVYINNFLCGREVLGTLARFHQLKMLNLNWTDCDDECIRSLSCHQTLTVLDLRGTLITDETAQLLSRFVALRDLNVGRTRLRDEGIEFISRCTELTSTQLEGTTASDKAYANLGKLNRVQTITLGETLAGDLCATQLSRLQSLIFIDLSRTKVTSLGARALLQNARSLEWVQLRHTAVDDTMFHDSEQWIGQLRLGFLDLGDTAISDQSLESLARCSSLKRLILPENRITEASIRRLKYARPEMVIGLR